MVTIKRSSYFAPSFNSRDEGGKKQCLMSFVRWPEFLIMYKQTSWEWGRGVQGCICLAGGKML